MSFNSSHYTSLADLVRAHSVHLHECYVQPILNSLQPLIPRLAADLSKLRTTFLGVPPAAVKEYFPSQDFWLESKTKDLDAQVRRFALGSQAKGLHARMRSAETMRDHLDIALGTPHPSTTVQNALDPAWRFVFTQLEAAFRRFGVHKTSERLISYRRRVRTWLSKVQKYCQPIQDLLNHDMPQTCKSVSGHVKSVFFYLLLLLTGFPNPRLAFRFWYGAPIVGPFESSALRQRTKIGGPLTDQTIVETGLDCARATRTVKATLPPAAAAKSMKKMEGEFASGTLRGPFGTPEELRLAIQTEIRTNPGFETFEVRPEWIIISPQFTVTELSAFAEADLESEFSVSRENGWLPAEFKVRNIWNAKRMNVLTQSYATYVPNTHSDVATIVAYWITLLARFGFTGGMQGWPADFASAYRQMPVSPLQILFAASAYFHYDPPHFDSGRRMFAFYTSLPFGSSIAPADWSETVVGLAHIMAYIVLAIITHCVDDVCGIEPEEMVHSARDTFLHLVSLIGLSLDMQKSLVPSAQFIYLGLELLLPARLPRDIFAIKIPKGRRDRLVSYLQNILQTKSLTSGEAASMRGRLFFYAAWFQESRSYLSEFAARQYASAPESALTEELILALEFFLHTLQHNTQFLEGIKPLDFLNRAVAWLYTDGSLEHEKTFKGIGGICFASASATPLWYGEVIDPSAPGFDHIAPVEMYAILRALNLFENQLRDKALWLFCDNSHSVGCLLRRSALIRQHVIKPTFKPVTPDFRFTPEEHFLRLEGGIRHAMNSLAREVWKKITSLNLILWVEYVNTKHNLADDPSREKEPIVPGIRVGRLQTGQPVV